MFVLGCKDLIVTTDHKRLLGIFKGIHLYFLKDAIIKVYAEN